MKFLLILFFTTVFADGDVNRCGKQIYLKRFFSKFAIQAPSDVVIGGYLPNVTGYWHCQGTFTHSGVHGVFISYINTGQGFSVGVSQEPHDPNQHQLYLYKPTNGNPNAIAYLRVCKWANKTLGTTNNDHTTGRDCLYNQRVSFYLQDNVDIVIGLTWDQTRVTVFADRIYHFNVVNNWSRVITRCLNSAACAMQYVYDVIYYNVNVTASGVDGISYSVCTDNCYGLATNVFAVAEGGYVPDTFSFHNWFLLTNGSTIVQGVTLSNQPLLVNCLIPIPKFQGSTRFFLFNESVTTGCNGYNSSSLPEAFRFNVNDTQLLGSAGSIILMMEAGYNVTFVCSNSTLISYGSTFSIPFGSTHTPYYCFLNVSSGNSSTLTFLSVLPPSVREIVITKYGDVYINGYGYLHLGELYGFGIDVVVSSSDVTGFWTIAATNFVDVLVEVNGTNINRVLYCDTPERQLRCSQLSFDLADGFYPIPSSHILAQNQPESFVTLPSFSDHSYVNVTITSTYKSWPPAMLSSFSSIDGKDVLCVNTRQFTFMLTHNKVFQGQSYQVSHSFQTGCPFGYPGLNNYLSFGKVCFSNQSMADSCAFSFYYTPTYSTSQLAATIYVQFQAGELITGVPQPLNTGVTDVSFINTDVCSKYTIYGFKGDGIISKTNETFIAGLYYTSASGQLLAFKNVTSGDIYSVTPCVFSQQAAFIQGAIVGVISSVSNTTFNTTVELPGFFYHSDDNSTCTEPQLVYSSIGVCRTGSIGYVAPKTTEPVIQPMFVGNVSVPTNFTMSVRVEYLQLFNTPVSIDCAMYVCNGNSRCNQLLTQYTSACKTIESALQLSARLESLEVNSMLAVSEDSLALANISSFPGGDYNFTQLLGTSAISGRSFIEDLLFDKVVTNGLGTVDEDYKRCSKGLSIADLACAQYYNGIMVLPGVVDSGKLHMYSASLVGGMVLGGFTAAASLPFSYAVQARLNYVALQTDVLQRNQQQLANAFNNAIGNISDAFENVNNAIHQTSQGLSTVAEALSKVQDVVNNQGNALAHLTTQLQNNFQAISASINEIYSRLDQITADAQVDRLITGRLAALNAYVSQTLTKYAEVQSTRKLAQQKVNECVKSQSSRYGFCGGDGDHIFSVTQAAPHGLVFLHAVLVPTSYVNITAVSGICVNETVAIVLRASQFVLFEQGGKYFVTPRKMFEPRQPQLSDFVQIANCSVEYLNVTTDSLPDIIPDYIDVNKTIDDILASLPNNTLPELSVDVFNQTYLNLTGEIADLENRAETLHNITDELRRLIDNINGTLVDLEWLNRVETYIKWPWWVWLIIVICLIFAVSLLVFCCISTGCCGCCGCCGACFNSCRGPRLQPYEPIEKVHVH
uniref:Spike glycoprotein n=1 Tax=Alphacoronavirus sp. TaxID=1906673 RepID=A0A8F0ZUE2_9ALPC|nr:spike glycoprotein [Alphacoronavirus sp.]